MTERVIAIGDVHGCATALEKLLDALHPASSDTVVLLGDLIDRGPDSKGVIDRVLELAEVCQVVPILGNHEEMLLAAYDRPTSAGEWLTHGGEQMLASYGVGSAGELPRELILFLRTWTDYWETPNFFFAHGNYDPHVPLARQEWGFQRWQPLSRSLPGPHASGKVAVVGHTSQKSGDVLDLGHLVCIDTYCHGGQWLTAFDTTQKELWQANQKGEVRQWPQPTQRAH